MLLSAGERAASTAKARVLRGRMLAPEDFDRLLECETVGAIATYLSRTEAYGGYFAEGARPETMRRWELEELIAVAPVAASFFGRYKAAIPERHSPLPTWGIHTIFPTGKSADTPPVETTTRILRSIG